MPGRRPDSGQIERAPEGVHRAQTRRLAVARHPPSKKFSQFDRVHPANARHCVVARGGTPSQDVNLLIAMILAEMLDGPRDDRGGTDPSGKGKPARPDAAKD